MSEQEEVPVWHSIVGEGWEPVQFSVVLRDKDGNQTAGGFVQAGKTYEVDALGQLIEVEVEE